MKIFIIDNYFEEFTTYYNNAKKIKLYNKEEFNKEFNTNQNWVGKRSNVLGIVNPNLSNILLNNFKKNFINYIEAGQIRLTSYIHERNRNDEYNDWIHKDNDSTNYVGLIYLSKTNLKSGTKFFDEKKKLINDVKFVQNRALLFDAGYNHVAYGHHDKRLNITVNINYI